MNKDELIQTWSNAIDELRKTLRYVEGDDKELLYHAGRTIMTLINKHQPPPVEHSEISAKK